MNKGPAVAEKRIVVRQAPSSQYTSHLAGTQPRTPEVFLHPGQSHVAASPVILKMILGSCAGVFLLDPKHGLGGATHFMLPRCGTSHPTPRYGDVAMAGLLERFKALGCTPRNIQAKVFGGACILSALQDLHGLNVGHIGERNVSCALEFLAQEQITVVQKDILGNRGREVSMISPTGAITLEFLSNADGNR